MTKYCEDCKQPFTLAERFHLRKHVCDTDILAAIAYKAQEEHKAYLERKRIQQELYSKVHNSVSTSQTYVQRAPQRLTKASSRRRDTDDTYDYAAQYAFSPSYSSYSSDSSSCSSSSDSSSSSSDSGSCSSGD